MTFNNNSATEQLYHGGNVLGTENRGLSFVLFSPNGEI